MILHAMCLVVRDWRVLALAAAVAVATGCVDRPPSLAEGLAATERAACAEHAPSPEAALACLDDVDCRYGVGPCKDGGTDGSR